MEEVLFYNVRLSKTTQGGLKHRKVNPRKGEIIADTSNERCVVKLFKKYLALVPNGGSLYLKPKKSRKCTEKPKFTKQVVRKNTLSNYLPEMYRDAKIDTGRRRLTGRSGRVTLCTNFFNEGFGEASVKKRLGHRSQAVRRRQSERESKSYFTSEKFI